MKKAIKKKVPFILLSLMVVAFLCFISGSFLPLPQTTNNSLPDTALVLIDIWEKKPDFWADDAYEWIDWWENDITPNVDNKILPLLEKAREYNVTIVFSSPYIALSPKVEQLVYGEPIINRTADLDLFLKAKGIKNIIYAGYSINVCVLIRPTGIRAMHSLGYDIELLEDCTSAAPAIPFTYEMAVEDLESMDVAFITSQDLFDRLEGKW